MILRSRSYDFMKRGFDVACIRPQIRGPSLVPKQLPLALAALRIAE